MSILLHSLVTATGVATNYLLNRKKKQDWRQSKRWREAKKKCQKLHNGKCAISGKKWALMDVHHIEDASTKPHLRYSQKNLVLIKRKFHKDFHIRFMGGYDKPCSRRDWNRYLKIIGKSNTIEEILNYLETIIIVTLYVVILVKLGERK